MSILIYILVTIIVLGVVFGGFYASNKLNLQKKDIDFVLYY